MPDRPHPSPDTPPLNPSLTGRRPNAMFRIGELVHGRADVIHLEFGEPDFPTPEHIVAAARASLSDERQGYGPGSGMPWLRAAIAARVARVNRFAPSPERVIVTMGGTGGLMASLLALCAPGDDVLTPDPGWPGYEGMFAAAGVRPVRYPLLPGGWQPDLGALEGIEAPRARLLLVNSPSNPGGAVFPRATIERLVAFAERRGLWILSDECYDEFVYEGEHVSPATLAPGRVVTVGTCSKPYAMTGWRVGWVVAPPAAAPAIAMATAAAVNNLPIFVQRAAEAALTGPQECVRAMAAEYRARRDLAVGLLAERGLAEDTPVGAFYLLINVARAAGVPADRPFASIALAEALLAARGIAVGPGEAFGSRAARYARVSLASGRDDLRAGITGLLDFARNHGASR